VRPYLNPYGSQSSRYQPKSTSFLFLKPAWVRSLVKPKNGKVIVGIDYKSEEALIGGVSSQDRAMIEAYESGDVYLDFAKRAGAVPPDGTKDEYKETRNLFKSTYLGISYLMGAKSLAEKLTADTGKAYTQEDAQELIDKFYKAYPRYASYLDKIVKDYHAHKFLKLPDGWVMFGDNDNFRSVSNCPIQGAGGAVLRKAIQLAQDSKLKVIIPLHDALYIESDFRNWEEDCDKLAECMIEAFKSVLPYPGSDLIRLDCEAWGDDLEKGQMTTLGGLQVQTEKVHIDPRGANEYNKFKRYFTAQ
jgi:DNA polymerase I-like protein with 3'-5' exonuclease and polymerase domains